MYYKTAYLKVPEFNFMDDVQNNIEAYDKVKGTKVTIINGNPLTLGIKSKHKLTDDDIPWDIRTGNYDTAYETFKIPKRSGGYREICAPNEELKKYQKQLLVLMRDRKHILEHNAAHGFVKGRNCKSALKVHQANESRWFLKLDIHNFFPSWDTWHLRFQLNQIVNFQGLTSNGMDALLSCACKGNCLTQGSPLSPYLTNLAMIPFDYYMTRYCENHQIIYTRYADDMLFSSKERQPLETIEGYTVALFDTLDYPLMINFKKTRLGSYAGRNWNLGIMYNQDHNLTVGYRAKHLMKVIIHKKDTLTPEELVHWQGVLAYYKSIEPEYFARFEL